MSEEANNSIIKIRDVQKSYFRGSMEIPVLNNITFDVSEGEFLALMGPSGSGKTTLLNLIAGIDKPSKGSLTIAGTNIAQLSESALAKWRANTIGFIFQFYHLLGEFSVLENVTLPALIGSKSSNVNKKAILERAAALLEMVGMSKRLNHLPGQLSGGEMQRVAIARALINNPRLLLCDEPTGNLDSENGLKICSILKDLNNKNNTTIIIVTHDESVARLATKVIHIKDGLILN